MGSGGGGVVGSLRSAPLLLAMSGCSLIVDGDTAPGQDASSAGSDARASGDASVADSAPLDAGIVSVVYAGGRDDLGVSDSGTDLVVGTPNGTAPGDLLLAAVTSNFGSTSELFPTGSGWTLVGRHAESAGPGLGVWWRSAEGEDVVNAYGFEVPDGSVGYALLLRFTGHASDPIDATAVIGGESQNPPCPSIAAGDNTLTLCLGAFEGQESADDAGLEGYSTIVLGGGMSISAGAGYRPQWTAGDTPEVSFELSQMRTYRTMALAIAGEE